MAEAAQPVVPTAPNRPFEGHEHIIIAVAVFPDRRRMVTGSYDKTLRLWDLKDGVMLKKMDGHRSLVEAVAVSGDGKLIASGGQHGEFIAWQGDTGESLIEAIKVHSHTIRSLDFSPDGTVLATGSWDKTTKLWSTKTWEVQGTTIDCCAEVYCVRFSPSGEIAIATDKNIQIWNLGTRELVARFNVKANTAIAEAHISLAWTPDGTRLLSAGSIDDPTIREWDTSTWQQVGDPWNGHTDLINAIAVDSTGTLAASASHDKHVRLWRLSDGQTISIFKHSLLVCCVTFSVDGKRIFSGGFDEKIFEWGVPEDALLEDSHKHATVLEDAAEETKNKQQLEDESKAQASQEALPGNATEEQATNKILAISVMVRNACIDGNLPTAEKLLTQEIDNDGNDHNSYANRSFVLARRGDWNGALQDARRSISIQPSLPGFISQGIALCGKMLFRKAMKVFDLAFMFTDGDPRTIHLLLLVKAVSLFNANRQQEAMLRIQELATACPNADTLSCRVVKAYLHVQLGINALDDALHNEAAGHFTAAISSVPFSSQRAIHSEYEVFVVLFGWDLKSLWQTANQKRCHALLQGGRLAEAHRAYRFMIDMSDEALIASCHSWSIAFKQALYAANGDAALAAKDYNRAIELYSVAIGLDSTTDTIFASRCTAKLGKMEWDDALVDAQRVIELSPSSYLGYQLNHAALHGAQRYDEAITAFDIMLSKLDHASDRQIRKLRHQYVTSSVAASAIQEAINAQLDNTPHRLLNVSTGRLCDRQAQINAFKRSVEYKELLSFTIKYADLRMERIEETVEVFFHCVMLSHRWEEKEPLLYDIEDYDIYELDPMGGIEKLQSFCKTTRDAGFRWAWVDTCCIDQTNNVEVQESVNSMFVWYHHSALTIVYLSDVLPLSKSGALAKSIWNKRGWTVQEFLAPKIIRFYQKDWTLYLNDRSPNHKESAKIMRELGDATGIDARSLVTFRPSMRGAREKLQWVSTRVTTLQEDIAYSLFGIFGVNLPVIYGEKKQNALGRLLQEVVAQSGDITALDWVGKSSEFNSCLPADITSYGVPSCTLPSLSEDEMQGLVLSLRDAVGVEPASRLYYKLNYLSAPRFAARRLQLPCIIFPVTEVRRKRGKERQTCSTFVVKADGLHDLLVTTEDKLTQFSRSRPARHAYFLVRPWDRSLLEVPDLADDTESLGDMTSLESLEDPEDWTPPVSQWHDSPDMYPGENGLVDSESHSRAVRLIVRLRRPFSAFLLTQKWGGEYKRIASDQSIIARVKDMASVHDLMDVRTLEIL